MHYSRLQRNGYLAVVSTTPQLSLQAALCPAHYDDLVAATATLCQLTSTNMNPSLATKTGHALKKCVFVLRNEAIRTADEDMERMCNQVLLLHDSEWGERVSRKARVHLQQRKSKAHPFTITSDLMVTIPMAKSLTISIQVVDNLHLWITAVQHKTVAPQCGVCFTIGHSQILLCFFCTCRLSGIIFLLK